MTHMEPVRRVAPGLDTALPALLLALAAVLVQPAQAQTVETLVGNTGQGNASS